MFQSLKKEVEKKKSNDKCKKAMITTWSDSDSSGCETKEDAVTNLCFIADEKKSEEKYVFLGYHK